MRKKWMMNMPLLLAALGLFATGCEQRVDVVDYEGYEQLVKSHSGKVVLVDYWATW